MFILGAKLFYLSNLVNGEYLKNEVRNLSRFILVQKLGPLSWRASHGYVLADRYDSICISCYEFRISLGGSPMHYMSPNIPADHAGKSNHPPPPTLAKNSNRKYASYPNLHSILDLWRHPRTISPFGIDHSHICIGFLSCSYEFLWLFSSSTLVFPNPLKISYLQSSLTIKSIWQWK